MSKVKKVLLTILAALIGVLLLFCAAFYVFFDVPDWQKLDISRLSALAQTSSMYDMNGELMSELRGSENRIIVSLDYIRAKLSWQPYIYVFMTIAELMFTAFWARYEAT